jgi:hypothetical protein
MTNLVWQIPVGLAAFFMETNGNFNVIELKLTNAFSINEIHIPASSAPPLVKGTKLRLFIAPEDFFFHGTNNPVALPGRTVEQVNYAPGGTVIIRNTSTNLPPPLPK